MSQPNNPASGESHTENVWYPCNCHCGATSFKIFHEPLEETSPEPAPVIICNCSICAKNGYLLIYVLRNQIEYLSGWEELKNYRFASKTRDHKFCGICGTSIGIDFLGLHKAGDIIGINARLIQEVDIDKLNLRPVNGKMYQAEYNGQHV